MPSSKDGCKYMQVRQKKQGGLGCALTLPPYKLTDVYFDIILSTKMGLLQDIAAPCKNRTAITYPGNFFANSFVASIKIINIG